MGRPPRLEYPGLVFHVFSRGTRRSAIYRNADDYLEYLTDLERLSRDLDIKVLAFTLMPNHPHMSLMVGSEPLCVFIQRLHLRHAQRFNRAYRTQGHLFEARYKAQPIDSGRYLLTLIRYIHLNPVRAGLVAQPDAWPYSSHRAYLGTSYPWVHVQEVLQRVGGAVGYQELMAPRELPTETEATKRMLLEASRAGRSDKGCADLGFVGWRPPIPGPWTREAPAEPIQLVAQRTAAALGIDLEALRSPSRLRDLCEGRRLLARRLREKGYRLRQIGELLGRDEVTVSRVLGAMRAARVARAYRSESESLEPFQFQQLSGGETAPAPALQPPPAQADVFDVGPGTAGATGLG